MVIFTIYDDYNHLWNDDTTFNHQQNDDHGH